MRLSFASIWAQRRWARYLSFGLAEQIATSAANFTFVVLLARSIGVRAFGEFSVAWSMLMLAEAMLWGVFGDTVPAIAFKLPAPALPKFRGALLVLSFAGSLGCAGLALIGAAVAALIAPQYVVLLLASALATIAIRGQQAFRRLCYLDQRRGLSLCAAVLYLVVLLGSIELFGIFKLRSGVSGMVCIALASGSVASAVVFLRKEIVWPDKRILSWAWTHLWRSGRWLIAAAVGFWVGNLGFIPIAGAIHGVEASGSLRILQNLTTPLSQLIVVLNSIILPPVAKHFQSISRERFLSIGYRLIALNVAISLPYVILLAFGGGKAVEILFRHEAASVSITTFFLIGSATLLDNVRAAAAVPLLAVNKSRPIFASRVVSLLTIVVALPLAAKIPSLDGIIAVMVAGNIAAMVTLLVILLSTAKTFPADRRAASVL